MQCPLPSRSIRTDPATGSSDPEPFFHSEWAAHVPPLPECDLWWLVPACVALAVADKKSGEGRVHGQAHEPQTGSGIFHDVVLRLLPLDWNWQWPACSLEDTLNRGQRRPGVANKGHI